ncbi:MAG: PQQ-dependent sugar dehydrogenase [Deltaproteobacteria bacterium]|nr:PQQ-dependent sugar dehydrogenase [Deltaproteobacteria bacterium]
MKLERSHQFPSLRLALALTAVIWWVGATPGLAGSAPSLELNNLTGGLSDIVAITHAGDSRLFLTDKAGLIRIWDGSQVLPVPFLDISSLVSFGFEQGLLSVAFHPDYATNGYFFVFYSDTDTNPSIARYQVMAGDPNRAEPTSGETLMTIPHFGGHYGGQLQFGPDGYLYFAIGDGGQQEDPFCRAQTPNLLQGKMMRIDVDQNLNTAPFYGIPPDNPFLGGGPPADEVWAIGFRNPWRFSFDRVSGDLFISDVGQFAHEEVNQQPANSPGGENYGWRIMEGVSCFDPDPIDPDCPVATASCFDPSYTMPIIDYDHSQGDCSITGGYVYRGIGIAGLNGRYVYGDWCTGNLWAALDDGGTWNAELLDISLLNVTTFGEAADGEIYLTNGSILYRIDAAGGIFADGFETGDTSSWTAAVP